MLLGVSLMNKRSTIYFDPELHKALAIKALMAGESLNAYCRNILRQNVLLNS